MEKHTKQTFKIYFDHAKKYKLAVFAILITLIITAVSNVVAPLFFKEFFNVLSGSGEIKEKIEILFDLLAKVAIVYTIQWISWRSVSFLSSYFQSKTTADLYNTCFAYLHKHSVSFFNNSFVGSLVKKVNRFARSFEGIIDIFSFEIIPFVVNVSLIIVVLFLRNIYLGIAILSWVVVYCLINYFFSLYKLKYDTEKSKMDSKVTAILADTITNHLNIKLFTGHKREKENFENTTGKLQKLRRFCWDLGSIFDAIQAGMMIALEILILYMAIRLWERGIVTIGDFVLIQVYLLTIFHRLWSFGRVIRNYYEYIADAKEMTEVLETPHEIIDSKLAKELVVKKGEIEFQNVSFNYHKTRKVISNFNLKIKANERVALIGESGSGKSTLVNLLLRNFELGEGKILIDGQETSKVFLESLWKNISLVPQDSILFHRTLKENIRYGNPELKDEEVFKASKLAHCDNFISNLPERYNTYVGERGIKLSGGERQRVSIARAILKNAPILVLDEATSSLDSESEHLIQSALSNLMKDKTVIVIAHRLSTIMKMDRIIVLKEGQIIEQGTHNELLQKKGRYSELWNRQVGGFIE